MNRQSNFIVLSLLLLVLFFSCKKEERKTSNKHGEKSAELFPLKLKNWWNYQQSSFDSSGKETVLPDYKIIIDAIRIINKTDTFYGQSVNSYWRRNADAYNVLQVYDLNDIVFMRYHVGSTATEVLTEFYIGYPGGDSAHYAYISMPGFQSASGYDNCIVTQTVIRKKDGALIQKDYSYLAPGVGIVRTDVFFPKTTKPGDTATYLAQKTVLKDYYLY